jgi:hypothetical protein
VPEVPSDAGSLTTVVAPQPMPVVCPVCQRLPDCRHGFYERILANRRPANRRGRAAQCGCACVSADIGVPTQRARAASSVSLSQPLPPPRPATPGVSARFRAILGLLWADRPGLAWPSVWRSRSARIPCCGPSALVRRLRLPWAGLSGSVAITSGASFGRATTAAAQAAMPPNWRELARQGAAVAPWMVRAWATQWRRARADALDAKSSRAVAPRKPTTINWVAFLLKAGRAALRREDRALWTLCLRKH